MSLPAAISQMQVSIQIHEAILQPSRINYLKNNHRSELELMLAVMLEMVAEQFNVKSEFTANQVDDTILTILADRDFGQLSPEEILYVFRCAKTGKYGPVYNKMDCITICDWLRTYMDGERMSFFQQQAREPVRGDKEVPIAMLSSPESDKKSQLQIIKDRDAAKLREKLRTQMEEFRERERTKQEENTHESISDSQ